MKLLIYIILLLGYGTGYTQDPGGVLKSLQNKFDSISDLTADVLRITGGKSDLSGKLHYKKGNKLRLEFPDQTIVADGKTSWNFSKREKKVIISSYEETGSGLLSIDYLVYQYPSECDLGLSAEGSTNVLILKPKSKRNNLGEIKLYVSEDNLITKVLVGSPGTGKSEIHLSNHRINRGISEAKFSFIPPEGTSVIDLR